METLISSSKESMCTIMRLLVEDTFLELSYWILNQEQWTQSDLVHSGNCSDPTTLFSDNLGQETTGPRVTTQRDLILLTQCLMLSERKQKAVIAFKDSKLFIHSEVELVQEWEHYLFQN